LTRPSVSGTARKRRGRRARGLRRLAVLVLVLSVGAIVGVSSLGSGPPSAKTLADQFAAAWARRDWQAMYAQVDSATQVGVPYSQFASDYAAPAATATVIGAKVLRGTYAAGSSEVVTLRVRTRIFGTMRLQYTLPLTGSGNAMRILWHPNLAFPELYPGEVVHRVTVTPTRGQLLARDGVPLASLASASNVIGSVATAGGSQEQALEADGFPAGTLVGTSGLEYLFNRQLEGRPGGKLFAGPRIIADTRAVPGTNVRTSIDPELQNDAVSEFGSSSGGIVVMAPRTGELLAVAGSPLSQTQPPGSTFKIVTATGVLEARLATINSTYAYGTYAKIDGYKLHNSNSEDCGGTLINAFAVSCNSVYAPLGIELGAQRLVAAAETYGFNKPSPIAIAAESTIPQPTLLTDPVALGSSAIGQYQDLASPLQMLRIAATIALGGREPTPTFATGVHPSFPRVIPAQIAHTIRKMMIAVVRYGDGTGVQAQLPGVLVAGKTGTAQLTLPNCASASTGASGTTGASGSSSIGSIATPSGATGPCANIPNNPYDTDAWFVSFAPAFHPKIAVGVLLDHDGAGGTSAAPIARDLIADALELGY
jgi:cell division protein FtsI/penicillin-binding protein 2